MDCDRECGRLLVRDMVSVEEIASGSDGMGLPWASSGTVDSIDLVYL